MMPVKVTSVTTYVVELQHLWSDLDQCDPLEPPHAESMEIARAWIERRRVMQFLKGLNQSFEGRCASVLHQQKLTSLDEAIAAMSQEEVRLRFQKGSGRESAFRADHRPWEPARRDNRECFNCGITGHLSRCCTTPRRGRGRGYNGGSNRGRYSGNGSRGTQFGGGPHRAHMTTPSEANSGPHENKPSESAPATMANQEAASFGHFAQFVYNNEDNIANIAVAKHKASSEWVLDSGTSKHVTGNLMEFICYHKYPFAHKETMCTTDCTTC